MVFGSSFMMRHPIRVKL